MWHPLAKAKGTSVAQLALAVAPVGGEQRHHRWGHEADLRVVGVILTPEKLHQLTTVSQPPPE